MSQFNSGGVDQTKLDNCSRKQNLSEGRTPTTIAPASASGTGVLKLKSSGRLTKVRLEEHTFCLPQPRLRQRCTPIGFQIGWTPLAKSPLTEGQVHNSTT